MKPQKVALCLPNANNHSFSKMMHHNQIPIELSTARTIIHDQFPEYINEQITHLGSTGTVNAIFRIGSNATARFPLQNAEPTKMAAALRDEAVAMADFAEQCPFPAPKPLRLGQPSPLYPLPWSAQSWVEGDVATPDGLASSRKFALDIVHLIASLRKVDTCGRAFGGQGRGGRLRDHDQWMQVCFQKSKNLLDVSQLERLWIDFRDLPSSGHDVMSHKDLIPANILVENERIVGVLDSGSFGPTDPALDLVAVWHMLDWEQQRTVRSLLGSTEVEWKRGAAWAFVQAMGLIWYYQYSNSSMCALGRSTLRRILSDHAVFS